MKRLVCVVEGHGEVAAVPRLCLAIRDYLRVVDWIVDPNPVRMNRSEMIGPSVGARRSRTVAHPRLLRAISLAWRRPADAVLVLCDSDDDCAVAWRKSLEGAGGVSPIEPVMAVREYESWLLWNAPTALLREFGVPDPEAKRDGKGALARIVAGYTPTTHQLELTRQIDISRVRSRSKSFDKLVRAVAAICGVSAPARPIASQPPTARRKMRSRS